jgi:hypothetical protein
MGAECLMGRMVPSVFVRLVKIAKGVKMKNKKLVVEDLRCINGDKKSFKVKKATNTMAYHIGQYIDHLDMAYLIKNNGCMTVDIVKRGVFSK